MNSFEKYPAVKFAFLFIAGILIGQNFYFNIFVILSLFLLVLIFYILKCRKSNNAFEKFLLLSLLIILAGVGKATIDFHIKYKNSVAFLPDTDISRDIQVRGIISEPPDYDSNKIKFYLECKNVINGQDTAIITGKVLVYLFADKKVDDKKSVPVLKAGDEIISFGKLSTAPGEKILGGFNYRKYLELKGIDKIYKIKGYDNILVLSNNNINFIFSKIVYPAREFALKTIDEYNPPEIRALLKGLVVGERSEVTDDLKESFINSGLMHILAVSGLNVAYIILFLTIILSIFRLNVVQRTIVIIIVLTFYCLFTGAPASIIRASIMGSLILIAYLLQRKVVLLNIIAFSVILILSFDSRQIFDAGFILSYSAIISMALFYDKIELFLKSKLYLNTSYKKLSFYLIVLIASTISAQIGVLPITSIYFGKISLVSLFTNIIVVPVSNFCLALGFLQIIFNILSGILASSIAEVNNLILSFIIEFIKWTGDLSFAYISSLNFNFISTTSYYFILLTLFTSFVSTVKKKITISLLIVFCTLVLNLELDKEVKIIFFDVGQGDATLIQTTHGQNILIDAGPSYQDISQARKSLFPYLRQNNINDIDLLIITHKHADHIGGILDIIKNFNVKRIVDTRYKDTSTLSTSLEKIIIEKKIIRDFVCAGDIIELAGDSRIFVLYPGKVSNPLLEMNPHFNCIVLKFKFKHLDVLLTSDIGKGTEKILTEFYGDFLRSDILKIAHHGSKNSSLPDFLVKTYPIYSVISCGLNNRFNHPALVTLLKLSLINSIICRTDIEGSLIFQSDGKYLKRILY
ncbi:MAG: DNA internalization-related competence protein ComEC/Rec2 [Ignavibacteria bacterium]|nr:DNA internalization-related competence protein ComEC/Rec2 [Ignavibacteria bacterium]